jgi:MoaA/NifB/PqqE/SkfB family radical SAM enzyme
VKRSLCYSSRKGGRNLDTNIPQSASIEELPEFRVRVSSQGGEPVAWDIIGKEELDKIIDEVTSKYPQDTIYISEVLETVILVIGPGQHPINMT